MNQIEKDSIQPYKKWLRTDLENESWSSRPNPEDLKNRKLEDQKNEQSTKKAKNRLIFGSNFQWPKGDVIYGIAC